MARLSRLVLALTLLLVFAPSLGDAASNGPPPGFPPDGSNIPVGKEAQLGVRDAKSGGETTAIYWARCSGNTQGWPSSDRARAVGYSYMSCDAPAIYQSQTISLYRCEYVENGICYNGTWVTQMGPTCSKLGWGSFWCPAGTAVYAQTVYTPGTYIEITKHWASSIGTAWSSSYDFWLNGL